MRQDLKFMLIPVFDLDTHLSIQPKLLAVWLRARYKLKFSLIILRQICGLNLKHSMLKHRFLYS